MRFVIGSVGALTGAVLLVVLAKIDCNPILAVLAAIGIWAAAIICMDLWRPAPEVLRKHPSPPEAPGRAGEGPGRRATGATQGVRTGQAMR